MAGHSKWKNIQHRKGRQDAIKGKIFAKLAREIYVAARKGDKDPTNNNQLRIAIAKAKTQNMPNENIERAIKKAAGDGDGKNYESITYEGYGPEGIAVMVEALTDNRNRTAADIRHTFAKHGGNLGESGCVSWMFSRKGLITLNMDQAQMDQEDLELFLLEQEIEDFEITDSTCEIYTKPEKLESVQLALENAKLPITSAEVTFVPQNKVTIKDAAIRKIFNLIDTLEENDDVQAVYANFEIDEAELLKLM